jgi:hypothetical protein
VQYEIGYSPKGALKVSVIRAAKARSALEIVHDLQASDEEIRHIRKLPTGGEIGIGELELEAECESNSIA